MVLGMSESTVTTIEPGLNLPCLHDDPELFFYDIEANADGTLSATHHGNPERGSKGEFAHMVVVPSWTKPGRFGYLSLSVADGPVHVTAPKPDEIVVETKLGRIVFPAMVVVIYHRRFDEGFADLKGYYEERP